MNIKNRFLQFWNLVRSRVIVFYLSVYVLSLFFVDYNAMMYHAQGATLSRLMPTFNYLYYFSIDEEPLDREQLKEYAYYFEKVAEYIPRADALGVLGYLYFHLGKDKKAVSAFKRAIALDPEPFNFHYNLGVVYFRRGYYADAAEEFRKAIASSIDGNMNSITSSKIYFPLLGPSEDISYRLKKYLKSGFRDAYRLLISSYMYLKDYKSMLNYATEGIAGALDENKDLYYFAGLAAFHLHRYPQAGAFLKEYLTVNPDDGDALYFLALTLAQLGDQRAADMILQKAGRSHSLEGMDPGKNLPGENDMISMHIF